MLKIELPWLIDWIETVLGIFRSSSTQDFLLTFDLNIVFTSVDFPSPEPPSSKKNSINFQAKYVFFLQNIIT